MNDAPACVLPPLRKRSTPLLYPVGNRDFLANEDVLNLAGAIEVLGTLTQPQRAKVQRVLRRRERLFVEARRLGADEIGTIQLPVRREKRPGRNDPAIAGAERSTGGATSNGMSGGALAQRWRSGGLGLAARVIAVRATGPLHSELRGP